MVCGCAGLPHKLRQVQPGKALLNTSPGRGSFSHFFIHSTVTHGVPTVCELVGDSRVPCMLVGTLELHGQGSNAGSTTQ